MICEAVVAEVEKWERLWYKESSLCAPPPDIIPYHRTLGLVVRTGELLSYSLSQTVLVAEDSKDTRLMLKRAFEIKGYRVVEATNGQEALEIASQRCPNLIIMDLNMPKLDGLEAIRRVRELKGSGKTVPIVAITAFDVYGMERAALEVGCDHYLSKPFDMQELYRVLKGLGFFL
jgi:CheY-like chemotaxis protein